MLYKERLKNSREELNITQESIANNLGITKARYCQCETEYEIFPILHLITICDYLKISLDYVFGFTSIKYYRTCSDYDIQLSGLRFKQFRKNINYTQDKLAKELNIARSLISKYEKAQFSISTHALYTICKKYKMSADYLLGKIDFIPDWCDKNFKIE